MLIIQWAFQFAVVHALYPFVQCKVPSVSTKFFGLTGSDEAPPAGHIVGFTYSQASYWCTFKSAIMADPKSSAELKEVQAVINACYSAGTSGVWIESYKHQKSPFLNGWLLQPNMDLLAPASGANPHAPVICRYQ